MRCGVYTRFSSDSQHPASIDDQLLACRRYAAQQGWQVLGEHEYVDEALSGVGVEHRPAYRRLLAALAQAGIFVPEGGLGQPLPKIMPMRPPGERAA